MSDPQMARESEILFSTPEMTALFSDAQRVERVLAFEAALARAQGRAGLIPGDAVRAIESAAESLDVDLEALYTEGAASATMIVPLVRLLRDAAGSEAARYVHLGATSQDATDTATMLQVREGIDQLRTSLLGVAEVLARLATEHRATVMPGRTLLQQAVPVTFGLKAARWLGMVIRQARNLETVRERCIALQFGGAAGTLSSLGASGPVVSGYLAEEIGLPEPPLPWHTERDRIAEVAAALGTLAGAMGKIGHDLALLAQTEVGEVAEGGEGGRSSAMPQKRNPVEATLAISASRLAVGAVPLLMSGMVQAHERAAGEWQSEWATLPDLFRYTAGAVGHVQRAVADLQVNPDRMRTNLDATDGAIMAESLAAALAQQVGRAEAQRMVEAAVSEAVARGVSLRDMAVAHAEISAVMDELAIDTVLEPAAYLGSAGVFIDRALDEYRAMSGAG